MLPDGKHIIAGDDIIPFGEHPYAEYRAMAQQRADGPYRGSASKDLEIVEFADFQCPHCKDAQANMDKLAVDFPKARIVFQNYPLPQHPAAAGAAAYGVCVAKQGGSNAFFTFASAVFDGQDGLATADGATLTLNSAVTKAGLDPAKIAACAKTPAAVAAVDASVKLARDLNINQTPTLVVNGRQVPGKRSLRHHQADHPVPGQAGRRGSPVKQAGQPAGSIDVEQADKQGQTGFILSALAAFDGILRSEHARRSLLPAC